MAAKYRDVADRVSLGLIPSSESGWPLAVHLLKSQGGLLHVHMNVSKNEAENFVTEVCRRLEILFLKDEKPMSVSCIYLERVKSYAPQIIHVVADLKCVPLR